MMYQVWVLTLREQLLAYLDPFLYRENNLTYWRGERDASKRNEAIMAQPTVNLSPEPSQNQLRVCLTHTWYRHMIETREISQMTS